MSIGTVKWFSASRGFGVIAPKEGGDDLYAHYADIKMAGYRTLQAGETVEFDSCYGQKGAQAINIRIAQRSDRSAPTPRPHPT